MRGRKAETIWRWTSEYPGYGNMWQKTRGVKLNWDPSALVAEHMSMEVSPRCNPQEWWYRKNVVQTMEAWAEFTPYLASAALV